MSALKELPAGQLARKDFPRFGLTGFVNRFPSDTTQLSVSIGGDVPATVVTSDDFNRMSRHEVRSDFHCVTTWSTQDLQWSGFLFRDFYECFVRPKLNDKVIRYVLLRGQDGYRTSMLLSDLLASDVLLADSLADKTLSIAHGAPLRLVAPAHYGYKNVKHLSRIEFYVDEPEFRRAALKFMDHPRARVAFEERGRLFPGWLLRYVYRVFVRSTVKQFERALEKHLAKKPDQPL